MLQRLILVQHQHPLDNLSLLKTVITLVPKNYEAQRPKKEITEDDELSLIGQDEMEGIVRGRIGPC